MQIQNSKPSWDLGQFSLRRLENANSSFSSCSSIFSSEPSLENGNSSNGNISTHKYFEGADPIGGYMRTTGNQLDVQTIKPTLPLERSVASVEGTRAKTGRPSQESFLEGCVAQLSNAFSPVEVSGFQSPSKQPVNCDLEFSFDSPSFCDIPAAENANTLGRSPAYLDNSVQRPAVSPNKDFTPITTNHPYEAPRSKLSPAEKLHNCKYCGKAYQNLASLKSHHKKHETGDVLVKRHKCPFCAHSNQYHRNLLKHIEAMHRQQNHSAATSPVNIWAKKSDSLQKRPLLGSIPVVRELLDTLKEDAPLPPSPLPTNESNNSLALAQSPTPRKEQSIAELLCSNSPETQNFIDAHSFSPSSVQSLVGSGINRNRTVSERTRLLSFNSGSAGCPESAEVHQCMICGKAFRTKQKLTHHMDIHNTRKPHFCEVPGCERAFSTQKYLQNHLSDYHGNCNVIRCSAENCEYVCNRQVHMKRHMADKHPYKEINNCAPSCQTQYLDPQVCTANSENSVTLLSSRTPTSYLPSLAVQTSLGSSASMEIPEFERPGHPSLLTNVFSHGRSPQNAEFYQQLPLPHPPLVPIATSHTRPYPLFDSAEPPLHASRDLPPVGTPPSCASTYNKRAATFFEQPSNDTCPKRFRSPCTARLSCSPNDAAEFPPCVKPSTNKPEVSDIDVTFSELNAVLSRDLDEIADKVKNSGESQSPAGQKCEIAQLVPGDIPCRSPSLYGSTDSGNGSMTSARSGASTAETFRRLENYSGDAASFSCSPPTPLNALISPSLGEKNLSSACSVPLLPSGGHYQFSSRCDSAATNFWPPAKQQHSHCRTLSEQDDLYQPSASWEQARHISDYENQELMLSQSDWSGRQLNAARDLGQHDSGCFEQPPPDYFANTFPAQDYHPPTSNVPFHITLEEQRSDYAAAPFHPAPTEQADVGLKSNYGTLPLYSSVYQSRSEFDTCDRNAVYNGEVDEDVANLGPAGYCSSPFPPVPMQSPNGFYGQTERNSLHYYPTDHRMPCGPMCTACPRTIPEKRVYTDTQSWPGQSADQFPLPPRTYFDGSQPNYGSVQTSHAFDREPRAYVLQRSETGSFVGDEVYQRAPTRDAYRLYTVVSPSTPQCVSSVVKPGCYVTSTAPYCEGQPYVPVSSPLSKSTGASNFALSTSAMDSRTPPWFHNYQPPTVAMQTPRSYASHTRINTIVGGPHLSSKNNVYGGGSGHPLSRFPSYQDAAPFIPDGAPINDEKMNCESFACSKYVHQSMHSIDNGCPLSKPFPNFDAVGFAPVRSLASVRQETNVLNSSTF